ncbi:MAG: Gmad2 immunoglobulin-like domain-containing protein [Actinomycetota bacterium]
MKRLVVIAGATALVLAGCAGGARSGGPVDTGPGVPSATRTQTQPPGTPVPDHTGSSSPTASPEPTSQEPSPQGTLTIEVWLAAHGQGLSPVHRTVPATQAVGTAALDTLLTGPTDEDIGQGIGTEIPPGTELLGISITDGVATVNLSKDFFSGGSAASEWVRLGQVVFTISQFASVHRGVEIHLDGDPIRPFDVDGSFLDRPWARGDFEGIVPAIVVESPVAGQDAGNPVTVRGTADVFEATVSLRLLDENRHQIASGVTTATCGSGCRGSFESTLAYHVDHEQWGTVEAFEASAKDGSPINVVDVPVILAA